MVKFSKLATAIDATDDIFRRLLQNQRLALRPEIPVVWKSFKEYTLQSFLVDEEQRVWYKSANTSGKFIGIMDSGFVVRHWAIYDFNMTCIDTEPPMPTAAEICILPEEIKDFVVKNILSKTPVGKNIQFVHTGTGCRPLNKEDLDDMFGWMEEPERWIGIDNPETDGDNVAQVKLTTGDFEWILEPYMAPMLLNTGVLEFATDEIRACVYLYCMGYDTLLRD